MAGAARISLVLGIVLPCVACDQATKAIALQTLESGKLVALRGGLIRFELAQNPGAFLSFGADFPDALRLFVFFVLVPSGLALLAATALRTSAAPAHTGRALVGLSLMVAGGVGNLLDRIFNNGAVVDFVSLGVGGLRTGIFNVADVAIIAGVLLFAMTLWRDDAPAPPTSD